MTESELLKEFIRVEKTTRFARILVCEIEWDGPEKPLSRWVVGKTLRAEAAVVDIQHEAMEMLQDPRFFGVCEECGERNPNGLMLDEEICQSCAVKNHHVVF